MSPPPAPASSLGTGGGTKVKIKLGQVIDQGCDLEVGQLDHATLLACRQRHVTVEGDTLRKRRSDRFPAFMPARKNLPAHEPEPIC